MIFFDKIKKTALKTACKVGRQCISELNPLSDYLDSDVEQALEDKTIKQIQKVFKKRGTQMEEHKKTKEEPKKEVVNAVEMDVERGKTPRPQKKPAKTPPSTPSVFSYYAVIEGAQHGPYDKNQFKRLVDKDMVSSSTMVWKEGMEKWMPAMEIEDMKDFFKPQTTPPPIPNF
jgi:hypothetical protein